MKRLLFFLLLASSCSAGKDIFSSKSDYVLMKNEKYIQAHVVKGLSSIGVLSKDKIVIHGSNTDTLYIFSTVISNENMFYSKKNIVSKNNRITINSYYNNFIADAVHSGIKKYNFIELLPKDSLIINVDRKRIQSRLGNTLTDGRFHYYYFSKKGENFNGLVNITKHHIAEKSIVFSFR